MDWQARTQLREPRTNFPHGSSGQRAPMPEVKYARALVAGAGVSFKAGVRERSEFETLLDFLSDIVAVGEDEQISVTEDKFANKINISN